MASDIKMSRDQLTYHIPKRFIVVGLCGVAFAICYAVAIVFMAMDFGWSSTTQGIVLSAFFVGYLTTQVLGGALADKFGGKPVLAIAAATRVLFTLLTPKASEFGLNPLIICRICVGIGEGALFPGVQSLIAKWIPAQERSRAVAVVTGSSLIGAVIGLPLATWLGNGIYGWECIFYLFGTIGMFWSLLWQIYGSSLPDQYEGISQEELKLIKGVGKFEDEENNVTQRERLNANPEVNVSRQEDVPNVAEDESSPLLADNKKKNSKLTNDIPWKLILSRKEVWALLITYFCNSWGYFIMLTWLPTYYLDHFGIDIKKLGYFAVIPYAVQGAMGFVVGTIGDHMIHKVKFRVITIRRIAQSIGSFGVAIFLLLAAYFASTPFEGIILITIGMGLNTFTLAGVSVNQFDIAPKYAGIIYGLGNTLGVIPGIFGVALTGWILDVTGRNWNIIWDIAASLYFSSALIFLAWAGGDVIID
ncbi:3149_t:CDS:2 [Funneliformis geosporum]|uniref:624_t:CDS:1 n=1 Tax=Funneliformis geosporum TaxID=1117311 RepID=A0A9W4SIV8_9GLOM|nr:3149_t:CDS:2 [Funneliformis geosporum]CAI2169947.1 624_t:CDS:2 [Funneliformis geosporum]